MAAADGNVVEEDVAAWMAACGCDRLIQQELRTSVRAALNDEGGGASRHPFDSRRRALGTGQGRSIHLVEEVGAESRDSVRDDLTRHLVVVRVGHLLFLVYYSGVVA
jgi:hypothetical protein